MKLKYYIMGAVLLCGAASCSEDEAVILPDYQDVEGETVSGETDDPANRLAGFYVLNEGNMGANKATIDYFDYKNTRYARNIYPSRNPSVVMELGDTGNDIAVYGGRLYIVLTGSHKVEVCDAITAERIGQVDISSPRYIAFDGNYAYVTSEVGGTGDNGSVVRFNLSTLKTEGSVSVGLVPEEMVVTGGKLYVANSQNYGVGRFDNTISVIDLASFSFDSSITVGVNLHHLRIDGEGNMWVNSRGNYSDQPADLFKLTRTGDTFGNPVALGIDCTNSIIIQPSTMPTGMPHIATALSTLLHALPVQASSPTVPKATSPHPTALQYSPIPATSSSPMQRTMYRRAASSAIARQAFSNGACAPATFPVTSLS